MKKPKKNYSLVKHIDFMILDIIFIELSFFIACMVRYDTFMGAMHKKIYMSLILMVAYIFGTFFGNLYSGILRRSFTDELKSVFLLVGGLFVALTLYCFITKATVDYSRAVLLAFIAVTIPLVYVERLVWKEVVRKKLMASKGEVLLFIE